ncbi:MAG: hypothetical protein LBC69_02470 [Eubacteriaceae bacterium]|nr:hypothetical protein [Eubacteriaceae bacterium]
MKIAITAGGTYEKIDEVRAISNSSTGILGAEIAKAFLALPEVEKIVYISGRHAIKPPASERVEEVKVANVSSLEAAVRNAIYGGMDAAVFSMAVSDYTVEAATTLDRIADFVSKSASAQANAARFDVKEALQKALSDEEGFDRSHKISSGLDSLVLNLKPTPKVIGIARDLAPEMVIVGFKLMDRPAHQELIDTAKRLMDKNRADYVFANDKAEVTYENHAGYLLSTDGTYVRLEGRAAIARAIASGVTALVHERKEKAK